MKSSSITGGVGNPTLGSRKRYWWLVGLTSAVIIYFASCGPVIATAFWLREVTHWDGWYAAMFLYYPILALGHEYNPLDSYIEFWVELFGTVGPG